MDGKRLTLCTSGVNPLTVRSAHGSGFESLLGFLTTLFRTSSDTPEPPTC
jgi:hypothetical protein